MAINPEGACSRKKIKGLADCRKITNCNLQQGQTTGNQKDTSEFRTSSEGVQSGSGRGLEAPNSAEFEAFGVRRGTSTKAACGHSTHRGTHCDHKPHPDKLPNRIISQFVRSTQSLDTRGVQGRRALANTGARRSRSVRNSTTFCRRISRISPKKWKKNSTKIHINPEKLPMRTWRATPSRSRWMEFTEDRIFAEKDENFTCRQRSTGEAAKKSPND